jgi:hypothetical protein
VSGVVVEKVGQLTTGTVVVSCPEWKMREKLALDLCHGPKSPLGRPQGLC